MVLIHSLGKLKNIVAQVKRGVKVDISMAIWRLVFRKSGCMCFYETNIILKSNNNIQYSYMKPKN